MCITYNFPVLCARVVWKKKILSVTLHLAAESCKKAQSRGGVFIGNEEKRVSSRRSRYRVSVARDGRLSAPARSLSLAPGRKEKSDRRVHGRGVI